MKTPPWYNSRAVSVVPLAAFLLLFTGYSVSQELLTSCGGVLAGCTALAGDSIARVARPDTSSVTDTAFAAIPAGSVNERDTAAVRQRKEAVARRQSALKIVITRLERRFVWAFFVGMNGILSLVCVATAALLARASPPLGRIQARGRILLVVLPAAAAGVLLSLFGPEAGMSVMYPILERTLGQDSVLGMPAAPRTMGYLNALSVAGTLALVLAVCMLISPPPEPDEKAGQLPAEGPQVGSVETATDRLLEKLDGLRQTSRYMRIFLYVGTAALIVGIFRMNATINWMQAFLVQGDEAILDTLRITMVTVVGGSYSLLLASLYLPAMLILRERAHGTIRTSSLTEEEKTAIQQQAEFSVSLRDVFPRIVAILGPLLAGPVGELMTRLLA